MGTGATRLRPIFQASSRADFVLCPAIEKIADELAARSTHSFSLT